MNYNPRQLPLMPELQRFGGKTYILGIRLQDWSEAVRIARRIREKHKVKVLIRKNDDGLYNLWIEILIQITKKGKRWLKEKYTSLCYTCRFGQVVDDNFICEYENYPSSKKRRCKYYETRESDVS